jgi:hypothetical protein
MFAGVDGNKEYQGKPRPTLKWSPRVGRRSIR